MSTGAEFVNIVAKRLFSYEDYSERFLSFLMENDRDIANNIFAEDCIFEEQITFAGTADSVITLSQSDDYKCSDGLGNFLSLAEDSSEEATIGQIKVIPIENTISTDYHVSLQYVEIPQGIEANPRNGAQQYQQIVQGIGVKAAPNSVVDNGGSLTLTIDSVCESSHSHAGRTALVYMVTPDRSATTEAVAIESCTVTWNGSNNRITTADVFGQNSPSTTASDYLVILLGPTVRKADISGTSGHVYLGVVEGVGAGSTPGTGDVSSQKVVDYSFESMLDWPAGPDWKDGTTNPATTLSLQTTKIVTDLAALTGAPKIGATAQTSGGTSVSDGSVATQIGELLVYLDAASLKSVYVLDATGAEAADYSGSSALQDAITDLGSDCTLFLRSGTYELPAGADYDITADNIVIIGESEDTTIIEIDDGYDVILTGNSLHFKNIKFTIDGGATSVTNVDLAGDRCELKNCTLTDMTIKIEGDYNKVTDCICGGFRQGFVMFSATKTYISNVVISEPSSPSSSFPLISLEQCSDCHFDGVISNSSSSACPGVWFEGSPEQSRITFKECCIRVGDDAALEFYQGSLKDLLFESCRFESQDGKGLHINATKTFDNISFIGCTFRSLGTVLESEILLTAKIANITFQRCNFENSNSSYYDGPVLSMNVNLEESIIESVSRCNFIDCRIIDTKSKGCTTVADPGTTEVPTDVVGVVALVGVHVENLIVDRQGITYDIQDSPWVKLTDCIVNGLTIRYDCDSGNVFSYDDNSDGLIEVLDNSVLKNLVVRGPLGLGCDSTNGWARPLLYIKGKRTYGITDLRSGAIAVVDGVEIKQTTTDEWYAISTLIANIDDFATLRRLTVGDTMEFSKSGGYNKVTGRLIELSGMCSKLEDCFISLTDGSTNGGLLKYVIYSYGSSPCEIINNKIYLDDPTVSTINLDAVVYFFGSSYSEFSGNTIRCASGALPYDLGSYKGTVFFRSDCNGCRVHGNSIRLAECTSSEDVIYFAATDFDGLVSGGNIAIGNFLFNHDSGSTNLPDINGAGSAPIGRAQNVYGAAGL